MTPMSVRTLPFDQFSPKGFIPLEYQCALHRRGARPDEGKRTELKSEFRRTPVGHKRFRPEPGIGRTELIGTKRTFAAWGKLVPDV
jgi:hypothetical protein